MQKKYIYLILFLCTLFGTSSFAQYPAGSPVAKNGQLSVVGTQLTSECGNAVQLKGMSTHGIQWFSDCYNPSSLDALTKDWNIDIIRIAMYVTTAENGYVTDPTGWKAYIDNLVDECGKRGIYCIIDWHIAADGNPNDNISDATEFWTHMSTTHTGKKHVLYEICNEPTVDWPTITTYANKIIPLIRGNDPKTVIIVGTPSYSSRVDQVTKLSGTNLMYTLHFYAGESAHNAYQGYLATALKNGVPVFVTEFGTTNATGDAGENDGNTSSWLGILATDKVSWCNWSFSDKAEGSAALKSGSCEAKTWDNTTSSGTYIKTQLAGDHGFKDCGTNIVPPVVNIITPLNDTSIISGSSITLTATVTSSVGTVTAVKFYNGTTLLGTSTSTSSPYTYTLTTPAVGVYAIKAYATSSQNVTGYSSEVQVFVNVPETPYLGTPWPIPGKIEAENYDVGGNNNAYYDNTAGNTAGKYRTDDVDVEANTNPSGYDVGYTATGEWLKYSVNVVSTGTYNIDFYVASDPTDGSTGKLHLELDGVNITGEVSVASTGSWTTWKTVTASNINITSYGAHIVKVMFDSDNINLDYFQFTATKITGLFSPDGSYGAAENVYPNPSSSSFNLMISEDVKTITVLNIYGESVETIQNLNAGQNATFGSTLTTGTYMVKVQYNNGKTEIYKLVKSNN
jgi:aryl-phospho-beta-D-glucosidase BglC (GH1 family)